MKRNKGIVATVTVGTVGEVGAVGVARSSVQVTRAQSKSIAAQVREEDIPISMFASAMRAAGRSSRFVRMALVALGVLCGLYGAGAPAAHAQQKTPTVRTVAPEKTTTAKTTVASPGAPPAAAQVKTPTTRTPAKQSPTAGRSFGISPLHKAFSGSMRFLPENVTRRSLTAPRYSHARKGRVQIGTVAPVNVSEKVVNLTVPYTVPDMRTPFWSPDETRIYYSSNQNPDGTNTTVANGRPYHLYYIPSGIPANLAAAAKPIALNAATDTSDYLYPALNTNSNFITFIRSSDGKAITDTTKTWVLCYASLPATGATIDPAATVIAGGSNITFPNATGKTVPFANIQRPSWLGNNNIVFSGLLTGDTAYHIFQANLQPTGGQSIIFQLTAGPADERDPAVAADGKTVAFDSTATPIIGTTGTQGYGAAGLPRQVAFPTNIPTTSTGVGTTRTNGAVNRNIFTLNLIAIADPTQAATGGVLPAYTVRQFSERGADAIDADNVEPAWSSLNNNQYSNPPGTQQNEYLVFASTRVAAFDSSDPTGTTITGYTAGKLHHLYYVLATTDAGNSIMPEGAIGTVSGATYLDTGDSTTTPLFDDRNPTWSPFISALRIGFQSDRTGDYYVDNFDGYLQTGQTSNRFALTTGRNSLLVATVIDVTAPSLLRFDLNNTQGEVLHINLVKNQNEPFDPSTSVRNSDDGVVPGSTIHIAARVEDRESGLRPDKAVFVQLKNPNSKYQSLFQGSTSPAEHKEYRNGAYTYYQATNDYFFYNTVGGKNFGAEYEAEAIGISNNIITSGNVLVNSATVGTTYYGHNTERSYGGLSGSQAGSSALDANDVLYQAGFDDQAAFSGSELTPLDGTAGNAAVWLELKPLYHFDPNTGNPLLDASGNPRPYLPTELGTSQPAGGVLYGASLTLPNEPSDWYMDVILYDNAVNPFDTNEKYNTIIYDNVWGFSSAPPITPRASDILVVSDYALGQKFFDSRFVNLQAGEEANNLLPIDFGTESYFTDVDVHKFLDGSVSTGGTAPAFDPYDTFSPFENNTGIPNTLGVKSYSDGLLEAASTTVDNEDLTDFGRYNIWRVLSRGPLTTNIFNAYLPRLSTRNPDVFPNPTTKVPNETTPQPVVDAQRMIIWNSPFSGDLFTGSGDDCRHDHAEQSDRVCQSGRTPLPEWTGCRLRADLERSNRESVHDKRPPSERSPQIRVRSEESPRQATRAETTPTVSSTTRGPLRTFMSTSMPVRRTSTIRRMPRLSSR